MIVFTDSTPRKMTADDMIKMEKKITSQDQEMNRLTELVRVYKKNNRELRDGLLARDKDIDYMEKVTENLMEECLVRGAKIVDLDHEIDRLKQLRDDSAAYCEVQQVKAKTEKTRADRLEKIIVGMNENLHELANGSESELFETKECHIDSDEDVVPGPAFMIKGIQAR
jgi:chromosome segregation ATPase